MKASEKRLLSAFLGLLALVGGLILSQRLLNWQHALERRERDLELAQIEADELMAEAAVWKERAGWLGEIQPAAKSELEANQELLETLTARAQECGVAIQQKQFQEPQSTDYYRQFGITLTAKGDLPAVFRWIYGLQAPGEFRVVPALKIVPDKEDPAKVVATVQFWRWYAPASVKRTEA